MHCQRTSDGGCLVYGQCKRSFDSEMVCVWKLLPDDFVVPWTLTEQPEVLPHQNVYPNPTGDCLNIVLKDIDSQAVVSVFDATGRKYFERRFDKLNAILTLDVSNFDVGTYYYEVVTDGRSIQKGKFLKK